MRAAVITVSDRVSRGEAEDLSGPLLSELLQELGFDAVSYTHLTLPTNA